MYERPPEPCDIVYLSLPQLIQVNFAAMMRHQQNWEIVQEAVSDWLRKNEPGKCGEPEFAGYQWKGLFLPDGTVLRAAFNGKHHHCHVNGDQILHAGKAVSPSGFVSAVGGIRRNAWKSIWVLLPDCKHWQLADHMRTRRRPPKARAAAHGARPHNAAGTGAQHGPPALPARTAPGGVPPPPVQQAAPEPPVAPPPRSIGVPRAKQAHPVIAAWVRKPRPRRLFAGIPHRLVALLRQELLPAG